MPVKAWQYIARRMLLLAFVLLGLTALTFAISHVIPADPARAWAGMKAQSSTIQEIRERYHLNEPLPVQYYLYLSDLLHGNLGYSLVLNTLVADVIVEAFPATFELTFVSMIIAVTVGVVLGILSAIKRNRIIDHVTRIFALTGISMPVFWLGLLLQILFYYRLGLLPSGGRGATPTHYTGLYLLDSIVSGNLDTFIDDLRHIILPSIVLSYATIGIITRITRSSMLEVLRQDYLTTARAKGLPERIVVYKHALRNALIPTVTVAGLSFASLLGGAVLTETIFSWPGVGQLAYQSIVSLDFPLLMGLTLLFGVIMVFSNLIVDLIYVVLDPRIRLE
ncbi:MAG: ABC transporter permease [Candidatus Bathyarchaeia archaeon]|jgi:peptide/nickel transport system permease protein